MHYLILADLVVILHFAFVIFVIFGGLLVLRRPRVAWLHVPAFLWGAALEFCGWICPLTPLENSLRQHGGDTGYQRGFIEHYLLRLLYPEGLTPARQLLLGMLVLAINAAIYGFAIQRKIKRNGSAG